MKLGTRIEIEGESYYVENIDIRENFGGKSYTIFFVNEFTRNKNIEERRTVEIIAENQRKSTGLIDSAKKVMGEEEEDWAHDED